MDKSKVKIDFDINQNRFNIINDGETFNADIDIYGNDEILWKIPNDRIVGHDVRWHKPVRSLRDFNGVRIVLRDLKTDKSGYLDIDPYGEENWDNDILIDKNWEIEIKVKEL